MMVVKMAFEKVVVRDDLLVEKRDVRLVGK
jgi:hypothetical protein